MSVTLLPVRKLHHHSNQCLRHDNLAMRLCWNAGLPNSVKKRNVTAITPFKVIQGHRFRYQLKADIRLPITD